MILLLKSKLNIFRMESEKVTDKSFLIAASDYILENTPKYGRMDFNKLLSSFDRKPFQKNISIQDENLFAKTRTFETVSNFMEQEGYIKPSGNVYVPYELTEQGIKAKELGGIKEYIKYRKAELNIFYSQRNVNRWLIFATILAALSPAVFDFYHGCKNIKKTSDNNIHSSVDSIVLKSKLK